MSGPENHSSPTDAVGEAPFLNLTLGVYTVRATLSGFADYVKNNVPLAAGQSVPLGVTPAVAGVTASINVTAQTPVSDVRKNTTGVTLTLEELQNIPSARDPWVVMQTVATIMVDRINVGGSESGQ